MSRLQLDEDEIQVLVDIRQKMVPLVVKWITNKREETLRLTVLNARDVLRFELEQMFLCLWWDQGMSMEEYTQFLKDLRRLQELFEGFIDESVLGSARDHPRQPAELGEASLQNDERTTGFKEPKYPKFEALMRMTTDRSGTSDLSRLLLLPATDAGSQEAEQTASKFNINNAKRCAPVRTDFEETDFYSKDTKKASDKPASSPESDKTQQSHECLAGMISTLVRDPTGSYETAEGLKHKLFVSCGSADDKWQETTCKVVTQLPPLKHPLKEVKNVCETIKECLDNEVTLELSVHSSGLQYNPDASKIIKHPPVWPTLSLEEILKSDSDPLRPYDKVMLALNLSRTLLRMYSAEMKGDQWTAKDIYFLFEASEGTAYEAYNPYLAYSLLRTTQCSDTSPTSSKKFPVLVAFAQLLLEIATGRILGRFERRPERPDISLLEELEQDYVVQNIVAEYVHAVKKCLTANKDIDEGAESEEMQCRAVIRDAVADLEEAWSTAYATKGDPNFPFKFRVPKDILGRQKPNKLNGPATKISKVVSAVVQFPAEQKLKDVGAPNGAVPTGSPTQLFDESKLKLFNSSSNQRCDWAHSFLMRAREFYMNEIEELQSEERVRVAVLDTGVNEGDVFFIAAMKSRKTGTWPILERESFLKEVPVGDTFGHGTNVAALILKIAPEADLYVAKISDGQEVHDVDHIVRAIEWAQKQGAHIINMSFGLKNRHSAIEKAVRAAEGEGIICTVAASNYGGNSARAFPAKLDQVLCMHAGDGNGNKSGLDPTPRLHRENFSTLGVCIPSTWEDDVCVSGTSYAAPVAAGIAANVLRFVQYATDMNMMTPDERQEAFSLRGIRNIMLAMCEPSSRDGYNFVAPWRRMWNVGSEMQHVVTKIKEALKDDM